MDIRRLPLILGLISLWGCLSRVDNVSSRSPETGSLNFRVAIVAGSPFQKIVKSATLNISAADMDTLVKPLRITDTSVEGTVTGIPAGMKRKFEVRVYDSAKTERYRGAADCDIKGNVVTPVTINITPVIGTAVINGVVHETATDLAAPGSAGPFAADSSAIFLANFDENVTDIISGVNGTLAEGKYTAGIFGSALQYDSIYTGRPSLTYPATERNSSLPGTIEALVNYDKASAGFNHIVDKSWLYGMTVYGGKVALDFGNRVWWYSTYTMPVKSWTYLCGTFDGTKIRLYANGAPVDSALYSGAATVDTSWNLGIGNAADSSFQVPFKGKIDGVRISRKPRSAAEIAATWLPIDSVRPR